MCFTGRFDASALHIAHALKQTEIQKSYNKAREKPIDEYLVCLSSLCLGKRAESLSLNQVSIFLFDVTLGVSLVKLRDQETSNREIKQLAMKNLQTIDLKFTFLT